MIYVYDIILNWSSNEIYDFFEWELNDEIEHIKRIPLFKINTETFSDILNYDIRVEPELLNKIKNLTEVYTVDKIGVISYASVFTDGIRAIGVEFNEKGISIFKSGLLLDEEQDILMLSNKMMESKIDIGKLKKVDKDPFITRFEKDMRHLLKTEICDCNKKGNFDKLKYLYYECFGKDLDNIDLMYHKLLDSIDREMNNNHNKLYEVIKLSYQNKN